MPQFPDQNLHMMPATHRHSEDRFMHRDPLDELELVGMPGYARAMHAAGRPDSGSITIGVGS